MTRPPEIFVGKLDDLSADLSIQTYGNSTVRYAAKIGAEFAVYPSANCVPQSNKPMERTLPRCVLRRRSWAR